MNTLKTMRNALLADPIFVQCAGCNGEGRQYRSAWVYDRGCGYSYPDVEDDGECPYCEGFGSEEIEGEPITLEDLENV